MENDRFDQLTRHLAQGASRRRILGGLAGALVGGVGLTTGGDAKKRAKAQKNDKEKNDKVLICHKPGTPAQQEKEVPQSALKGHKEHGDTEGPCPTSPPPPPPPPPPPVCPGGCKAGETCIGGGTIGSTTYPLTCCPNGKVCGGPTADVQICCTGASTCTGDIPNQQCTCDGTTVCAAGETCIGGGTIDSTTFPKTCCPNGKVCGGPEAEVQICCTGGTECTGTIPNQQCSPKPPIGGNQCFGNYNCEVGTLCCRNAASGPQAAVGTCTPGTTTNTCPNGVITAAPNECQSNANCGVVEGVQTVCCRTSSAANAPALCLQTNPFAVCPFGDPVS